MQIIAREAIPVRVVTEEVRGTHVVLRLRTSDGIEAISYVSRISDQALHPLVRLIEQTVDALGEADVSTPEPISRRLYRRDDPTQPPPSGLEARAASAIDVALWDLRGKALGQPVYRLMGGMRDRVPVSANWGLEHGMGRDVLTARLERQMDRGFRAFKVRVGHLNAAEAGEHLGLLRDVVGPDARIMVDANQRWDVKHSIAMAKAMEPYDLYWIEDPVPFYDTEGSREVREAISTMVCAGEALSNVHAFRRLFQDRAADMVMGDLDLGLTGFRQVAAVADLHGLPVVNHLACEQLAHVVVAASNGRIAGFNPWAEPLFTEPARIEDGDLVLPDRPGLGLELDEEALERFAAH